MQANDEGGLRPETIGKALGLSVDAEARVTAPRENRNVQVVATPPSAFVDWDPRFRPRAARVAQRCEGEANAAFDAAAYDDATSGPVAARTGQREQSCPSDRQAAAIRYFPAFKTLPRAAGTAAILDRVCFACPNGNRVKIKTVSSLMRETAQWQRRSTAVFFSDIVVSTWYVSVAKDDLIAER
ncbi:MAG TPA: hypothetical protein DDZ51_23285 [Planctomycetaceae bacterium]|nr:hypothetical protein [Planctomycetaceae bacterium]